MTLVKLLKGNAHELELDKQLIPNYLDVFVSVRHKLRAAFSNLDYVYLGFIKVI